MAAKDDLITAALNYNFAGNIGFDEEACNNELCFILRKVVNCSMAGKTKKSCSYKTQAKCSTTANWCREKCIATDVGKKFVDLASSSNGKASLLAEVKIWKTDQHSGAFTQGHEYPFHFLGCTLCSGSPFYCKKIQDREKELQTIESKPTSYPKTAKKIAQIHGTLCCFPPTVGVGTKVTDADEGQLFKDFVKMLNNSNTSGNNNYEMLQVLYIVTETGKWSHVHDKKNILNTLEYLFKTFYTKSHTVNKFEVYKFNSPSTLEISFPPSTGKLTFPTAIVHFGKIKSVPTVSVSPSYDVTPLVIDWSYGNATANVPGSVFSPCSDRDASDIPIHCGCVSPSSGEQ